jgi:lipopolysaccharide transport system ATP-binding protein
MKPILEIRNISKKFRIQHENQPYLSLRDSLVSLFRSKESSSEDFYALKDISFDVHPGQSIGIIGKNGAGKSTLLKILSKITPPTSGKIISRGRIASLLEVGTGFHPELSGRENIFLNGSILAMKKSEIQRNFDAIVDFSGVEKFIDTPLKHYSSGMQLRLAFAVAAFLENEILIIDEVLAVGDAEFQKKCMDKMEGVTKSGRTILFVSHNLDAVESLCKKSVLLSKGQLLAQGPSHELIDHYISQYDTFPEFRPVELLKGITLEELSFSSTLLTPGSPLQFTLKIKRSGNEEFNLTDLSVLFYNYKKQRVAIYDLRKLFTGTGGQETITFTAAISSFNLIEGAYYVGLYYGLNGVKRDLHDLVKLQVKNKAELLKIQPYETQYRGYVELI